MEIRSATADDAELLAGMNQRLIWDEGHRSLMTLGELRERMRGWLEGEYRVLILQVDGTAAGYVLFREEPEWIYVRQLFVEEPYRRRGVGRSAVRHLVGLCSGKVPRLRIDVLVGNKIAQAFWRSVGFADYCITMELEIGG